MGEELGYILSRPGGPCDSRPPTEAEAGNVPQQVFNNHPENFIDRLTGPQGAADTV